MTDASKNKITKIIKALLTKAAGTDNENEAAVFATKAAEMMEQYQIEVLDVVADDPVDMTIGFRGRKDGPIRYKSRLCSAVGQYYGCRTVFATSDKELTVKLIGRESSRITAELMFPFMLLQCRAVAKKIAENTGGKVSVCERDIINALIHRLQRLTNEQVGRTVQPKTSAGKNALIVQDAIKVKMEDLFPNLKTGRATSTGSSSEARKAAEAISLNKQTAGTETKRLK